MKILSKVAKLETLEEKSFWVNAPLVAILGLLGLTTGGLYASPLPTIVSALMCFIVPIILMIFVYFRRNYHYAYPLLCIFIGAISIPITFVSSGGFLSGMPLFCVITTAITALCYRRDIGILSLLLCIAGNSVAFFYVYKYGTPYPIVGEKAIYSDILWSYYAISISEFLSISLIINEIRKYRISQDVLNQYFDFEVRKEIISKAAQGNLSLVSEQKKCVILFADISNFTSTTEKMSTETVSEFLKEFFTIAEKHIHNSNGIIDKYIGDCVMAYWFDVDDKNRVLEAVQSVLDIKKELYEKAEKIYEKYGTELNFSAGISYGDVIFGDIGSQNRHEYTIIGDAVNIASRIENYAAGGEILLSNSAANMIKSSIVLQEVETDIFFKGKNKSVSLYRVVSENKGEIKVLSNKDYGYTLYVCGCRGSFPVSGLRFSEYGGETSCYVIKKDKYAIIIDCGTGLKNAADIIQDCEKIDILLTHVHYDHILGFLMSKLPNNARINIYGYFDSWENTTNTLVNFMNHPYWPIEIPDSKPISVELEKSIELDECFNATFYKSDHPDEACVIKLNCKDKKICMFADCEDPYKLDPEISKNADLLFYDGMFDDEDIMDHKGWGHSTWQQGIIFAKKQNIKNLIITHHNPEDGDHTLLMKENKARTLVKNISFAKTGDRIII